MKYVGYFAYIVLPMEKRDLKYQSLCLDIIHIIHMARKDLMTGRPEPSD